jgi:hypothetical protein
MKHEYWVTPCCLWRANAGDVGQRILHVCLCAMSHVHGIKFRLSLVNCVELKPLTHSCDPQQMVGYPDMLRQNHTNQDINIL